MPLRGRQVRESSAATYLSARQAACNAPRPRRLRARRAQTSMASLRTLCLKLLARRLALETAAQLPPASREPTMARCGPAPDECGPRSASCARVVRARNPHDESRSVVRCRSGRRSGPRWRLKSELMHSRRRCEHHSGPCPRCRAVGVAMTSVGSRCRRLRLRSSPRDRWCRSAQLCAIEHHRVLPRKPSFFFRELEK
jgi:hypothetical protein